VVVGSTWHRTIWQSQIPFFFEFRNFDSCWGKLDPPIKKQTFVSISLYGNADVEEDAEGGRRRRRKKK